MRDLCNTDKTLFAVLTKLTYSAYGFERRWDRAGYFGHAVCQAGRFFWQGLSWGSAECTAPGACSRLHSLSVPAVIVGFHIKNKEKYHGHFNDW